MIKKQHNELLQFQGVVIRHLGQSGECYDILSRIQSNLSGFVGMIDLDALDPDWQLAKVHAKANSAGKVEGSLLQAERCPCCFRAIVTQPIGMFQNSKELQTLGFGYPLYLKFLKYSLILVFVQIFSYNLLQLYNGITDNSSYCQGQDVDIGPICEIFFVQIANLSHQITSTEIITRIGSFVIQMYLLIYIRNSMKKTLAYYKQRKPIISNFAILIKHLPEVPRIKSKLIKMFAQFFQDNYATEEIILIGYLQQYYALKQRKKLMLKKRSKLLKKSVQNLPLIQAINHQIAQVDQLLDAQIEKTVQQTKKDDLRCQKVIVIVESQEIQQKIIKQFQRLIKEESKQEQLKKILGGDEVEGILFRQAPEPEEIIWEHINTPLPTRRKNQILGWVFTVLFMAAITGIFYFIIKEKSLIVEHQVELLHEEREKGQALNDHGLQAQVIALVYILIFGVVLLNKFVISKFLHFISDFEKHPTYSKEEYYFSIKYTIALFLTTAVLTILVEDVTLDNLYRQNYGIVEEQSIMFLVNSFFVPFLWLVNPLQIWRTIQRKRYYGKDYVTQGEANQMMMDEPASLGKLFAETIQIIWFTFMYSSVIPMGALCIFVGFAFNYWIVKYNILRRSSISHQVSGDFILLALNLLDISLIMKPVGELLFDYQIRQRYTVQSIVCAIIGLLYCIMPTNHILNFLHREDFLLEQKTYTELKDTFATNYQMLHPIYSLKKIYVEGYIERLRLYKPEGGKIGKRIVKNIPISLEMALARRTQLDKAAFNKITELNIEQTIKEQVGVEPDTIRNTLI